MKYLSHLLAATALSVSALALSMPASADAPKQIRFGLLPAEDPTQMVEQFKGIAEHIGKELGVETNVRVSESYNALIEAMRSGHLEVVYVGGSQYLKMRELGMDVVPVVLNRDTSGRTYYKSCIISRSDSNIKEFADLKGTTFAFVTPTSTSGGIAPKYLLLKNDINPDSDFRQAIFAGKHDAAFLAVKNKKVDAGAVGDFYFWRWDERGILDMERYDEENDQLINSELHVVGCVKVPNTPMVTRADYGEEFLKRLQDAYMSVPDEIAGAYKIWPSTGFVVAKHEDFLELAEMDKLAE